MDEPGKTVFHLRPGQILPNPGKLSKGFCLSFPITFEDPDPEYSPDFDIEDNFNVLHISEIHAFEPEYRKDEYLERISKQLNTYTEQYNVDRVSILGDTGSIEDVEILLEPVDDDIEIWIVAGDEDKKEVYPEKKPEKAWKGWFEGARSPEPFDIENDYTIFDEGYITEINGHRVQAAHHPKKEKRNNSLSDPDPRAEKEEKDLETIEELIECRNRDGFLDRLFSVDQDSNEAKEIAPLPSMEDGDVFIYDHVHMPYIRKLYDSAVLGLGGRSHNYQLEADAMPLRSLHVTSYGEDLVQAMHFDAQKDQIFEHQVFDFEDELEIYNVDTPGSTLKSYLPLQRRFTKSQWSEEAYETEELHPTPWIHRDKS